MDLQISGPGIVLYSPAFARHIEEGADYLSASYSTGEAVEPQVKSGRIVGFGTGSPGDFRLELRSDDPTNEFLLQHEFRLRLAIEVRDGVLCVRDLFDLSDWDPDCPDGQRIRLEDGFYHLTLCSNAPESGVLGDHQLIYIFFKLLDHLPRIEPLEIPMLC